MERKKNKEKRPKAYIKSANVTGLVKIGFTEKMNKTSLEKTVKSNKISTVITKDKFRRDQVSKIIELKVTEGGSSKRSLIKFDWKFTDDWTSDYMSI